jgi:hypothetical protein
MKETILKLFKGCRSTLTLCQRNVLKGIPAKENAILIGRCIETINKNAGQEMDPTYVGYLLEYAIGSDPTFNLAANCQ